MLKGNSTDTRPTMADYIHALESFDWGYEFSDDHRVWLAGEKAYHELLKLQHALDPKRTIWNAKMPRWLTH